MPSLLSLISLLLSLVVFCGPSEAEVLHPSIVIRDYIPDHKAFKPVRTAYEKLNLKRAIQLTKTLAANQKNKEVAFAATFLLGDLYLDAGMNGQPSYYKKAIYAYQNARRKFRDQDEAVIALWKIGTIYTKQKLFYEAIAVFKRVEDQYPEMRLAKYSQFGKAHTYIDWEKWEDAIASFEAINPSGLTRNERMILLLGFGDTYYRMGYFNTAFQYYRLVPIDEEMLQRLPKSLFRYGTTAVRSKAYKRAREIFAILKSRYPSGPDTLLATARMGDAWRMEGMGQRAQHFYDEVAASRKRDTDGEKAKLAAAIGAFHLAGCYPRPLLVRISDCQQTKALKKKSGLLALERMETGAQSLIEQLTRHAADRSQIETILFETLSAFKRHEAYISALLIVEKLLDKDISAVLRDKLQKGLPDTVVQAVDQLIEHKENLKVVSTYFRHAGTLSAHTTNKTLQFQVAQLLSQTGFHSEVRNLLSSVASAGSPSIAEKALFYMIQADFQLGDVDEATKRIAQFISKYPRSARISPLQAMAAEMLDRQGKTRTAIKQYRTWLAKNPLHPIRTKILYRLAAAFEKEENPTAAISSYLQIRAGADRVPVDLDLKIGDLYYQTNQHKKAISFYKRTLGKLKDGPRKEWTTLHLANSYRAVGQRNKGSALFARLAGEAKDDLVRGIAVQKTENSNHE